MKFVFAITFIFIIFIFGLPHFVGITKNNPYISTVVVNVPPYSFDENHYAVRIQKMAGGNFNADSYTYEYRQGPWIFPIFSTTILGFISRMLGNVQNTFIVMDLILPPILFVTLYFLVKKFIPDSLFAILVSLAIILEDQYFGLVKAILSATVHFSLSPLVRELQGITSPPFYSRLENPELTGVFFFIALWGLALLNRGNRQLRVVVVTSIAILSLVYSYPFYWVFLVSLLLGLAVIAYIRRRPNPYFIYCLLIVFLGSLPYLVELRKFYALAVASDYSLRIGKEVFLPTVPISGWVVLVVLALLLVFRRTQALIFLCTSIIMVIASMWIFRIQTNHFISRILVPILRIAEFYILYLLGKHIFFGIGERGKKRLITLCLLVILGLSMLHAWFYSQNTVKAFSLNHDVYASYNWIKSNIPAQSVMLSYSIQTNFQLPAFADVYMFLPYTAFSFIPTDEVTRRLVLAYKCIDEETKLPQVIGVSTNPSGRWNPDSAQLETKGGFIYYLDKARKSEGYGFTREEIKELTKSYQNLTCQEISDLRKKYGYKVDYLYWGPWEKTHYVLSSESLEEVFVNGEVSIYKIK